jgi:hypothetical protein
MQHRFIGWMLCCLLLMFPVMAQEATPEATSEATPHSTETPLPTVEGSTGPRDYPPDVNPLTGQTVENPQVLQRRPVVVKVSNSPALVRPQAGIGQADHVYEHYTEVGITRFSAVFYGTAPQRVGSIRSARLIDYELVPMYSGLLAFAGASIGVDKRIYGSESVINALCQNREDTAQCRQEADIIGPAGFVPPSEFADRAYKGVLFGRPYYFRDASIPVPHNMFVNVEALQELAAERDQAQQPDVSGLAFHPEPQGTPAGSGIYAQVRYQTTLVEWYYDPDTALYYRSTDGQRHFDATTDEQIRAENVVIVHADHFLTDIVESQYADVIHWSQQITIWPDGDATLLRDGVRYEGRWLRPSRPELLQFRTDDGEILYFKPGQTWFQVVRSPSQMDASSEWVIIE